MTIKLGLSPTCAAARVAAAPVAAARVAAALAAAAPVAAALLAAACVDITPIYLTDAASGPPDSTIAEVADTTPAEVDIDDAADGAALDASVDGDLDADAADAVEDAPADVYGACVACLAVPDNATPPGCGTELGACFADPACKQTMYCALAAHCLSTTDFSKVLACGVPCAEEAGVHSQTSPQALEIVGMVVCSLGSPCVPLCQ